jgi:hypothetical protein
LKTNDSASCAKEKPSARPCVAKGLGRRAGLVALPDAPDARSGNVLTAHRTIRKVTYSPLRKFYTTPTGCTMPIQSDVIFSFSELFQF